jgi:hypothetical protein
MEEQTKGVMHCARHPREETAITCASCGTPICPRCMVSTPVGMKCPDCGKVKNSVLFKVSPGRLMLAGITALVAGFVAALIGHIGFFVLFVSIPYGYFAGGLILKASGMKRGMKLEIVVGAMMVIGALVSQFSIPLVTLAMLPPGHRPLAHIIIPYVINPFFWIALVMSTGAAVSKIRYL